MIFVDTGAFLAKYLVRDQHHAAARTCWADLSSTETHLITSCYVVSETLTLLARRSDYRFAVERARHLYASTHLQILRSTEVSEINAIRWFELMAGRRISFIDCISFALMQTLGVTEAFTFDEDFIHAGFNVLPRRSGS